MPINNYTKWNKTQQLPVNSQRKYPVEDIVLGNMVLETAIIGSLKDHEKISTESWEYIHILSMHTDSLVSNQYHSCQVIIMTQRRKTELSQIFNLHQN